MAVLARRNVGLQDLSVRSNSSESSGLKSRTRSCPYALVASGSGVAVTRGREFSNSKTAGRNASEPMSSLVNELEKPTLWSEGEGRWMRARITEVARIDSRGSKDGMSWKIYCPVLDTRCAGWGDRQRLRIRKRKRTLARIIIFELGEQNVREPVEETRGQKTRCGCPQTILYH